MKSVYLIPGFLASDLGILANHDKVWFDPNVALLLGIGALTLSPDGVSPLPPNGRTLGVDPVGQNPWPNIKQLLDIQLDSSEWRSQVGTYDWRFNLVETAFSLTANIITHSTEAEPATIVGHSAGGLVAVLTWAQLVANGKQNLCRRIISICTPFQGSYAPQQWLTGQSASVQQLTALATIPGTFGTAPVGVWALSYLNAVALTWPAFYQLMPSLIGTEAAQDPNRALLYQAGNYDVGANVSQAWLDFMVNTWQPGIAGANTFPPDNVMTCVVASSLATPKSLANANTPVALGQLVPTNNGDGVVTAGSQTRSPSKLVMVNGYHASIPLAITVDGTLADLIRDPRGPSPVPPPPLQIKAPAPFNTYDPPEATPYLPPLCIGGG